ncbi:hypothetical protein SCLCIDRAFT_33793 [Scleroderma citrinum Foug A]|uniref:Uncharacterized protein n=1 Tax=Scleroderma citrinum Foug A TaxID=1036808 RepID=A0A0C2ZDK4_9AGAM|nr:hypothetical protein SCLCIDRAFT_33793 [Scleroderma citrinum Foug A]
MPNISIATFRGVLWWLHGPDAFWIRSLFFHINTWVQRPYRHVLSHFRVAALRCSELEPSVLTLMPNESVWTICVSDGWPGRHSQQCFLHSIQVNVAAARCAVYTIVTSISTAIAIASSLSCLALNIWRNCLPSPLEPSELECSPQRLNRHVPRLCHRNFEYIWHFHICFNARAISMSSRHLHMASRSIHSASRTIGIAHTPMRACKAYELPQLVQSISALDLCTQLTQPLARLVFHAACLAC